MNEQPQIAEALPSRLDAAVRELARQDAVALSEPVEGCWDDATDEDRTDWIEAGKSILEAVDSVTGYDAHVNTQLSIEHINQPVEVTYWETGGNGPFRRAGILQGFYDTGKGVQFWMAGRSAKQYATGYTVRTLPPAEVDQQPQRISGITPRSRTHCERLQPEHINRVIEIEYTTAPGKATRRMAGRLTGYDETEAGLEWWMQGRTASRHAITYTIHHYPTTTQTSGADQ